MPRLTVPMLTQYQLTLVVGIGTPRQWENYLQTRSLQVFKKDADVIGHQLTIWEVTYDFSNPDQLVIESKSEHALRRAGGRLLQYSLESGEPVIRQLYNLIPNYHDGS